LNIRKSRENPRNLCEDASQGKQTEFAAAPGFDCAATRDCKPQITSRPTKRGRPLSRAIGSYALRILLLGAVFALANPWSMNQAELRAREFAATSMTPMIGGWWRFLVRADRAVDKSLGLKPEKQLVSLPDAKTQPRPQESGSAQPTPMRTTPADATSSGVQAKKQVLSTPAAKDQSPQSKNPAQDSENPAPLTANPAPPTQPNAPANEARPLNQIDQYLWSVYQRSATKRDSNGDFTWKDEAAAARLGLDTNEYVIDGMDPDFRELLYDVGHAMDAAGIDWTILSAFRDDYRQGLAAGFKAHRGYSFHGGSIATGGYGHGCAADLEAADGDTESNEAMWKWLDQHGEQFGIRRPMRQIDPAHVQPFGAWHEAASELREKRADIQPADLRSGTAGSNLEKQIFPVSASEAGVSEAQFECVRSHHHSSEHLRTARLLGHPRLRIAHITMWERRHRHARWRMLADTGRPERRPGAEASPNSDELSRTAKRQTAESRSPDRHPAPELALKDDESHQTPKWHVADTRNLRKREAAEPLLETNRRSHRNAKWRAFSDIRGLQKRPGAEAFKRTARSKYHLHFVGPSFDAAAGRS
jgi:hypothetical protein